MKFLHYFFSIFLCIIFTNNLYPSLTLTLINGTTDMITVYLRIIPDPTKLDRTPTDPTLDSTEVTVSLGKTDTQRTKPYRVPLGKILTKIDWQEQLSGKRYAVANVPPNDEKDYSVTFGKGGDYNASWSEIGKVRPELLTPDASSPGSATQLNVRT